MLNDIRSNWLAPRNLARQQTLHARQATAGRSMHILVPTGLTRADLPALLFGLQMAAMHPRTLTVLHVGPASAKPSSLRGLDAVRLLHHAADHIAGRIVLRDVPIPLAPDRQKVRAFLEAALPGHLLRRADLRVECRAGDVAVNIAQFAEEGAADVVIMTSGLRRRWWPVMPANVRRVLRLTRRQVILVHAVSEAPDAET